MGQFPHITWVIFVYVNLLNFSLLQICLTESTTDGRGTAFSLLFFFYVVVVVGSRADESLMVRIFCSTQKSWVCSIKYITRNLSSWTKCHSWTCLEWEEYCECLWFSFVPNLAPAPNISNRAQVSRCFLSHRRMFPSVRVKVKGLDPGKQYYVAIDVVPVDSKRYR